MAASYKIAFLNIFIQVPFLLPVPVNYYKLKIKQKSFLGTKGLILGTPICACNSNCFEARTRFLIFPKEYDYFFSL